MKNYILIFVNITTRFFTGIAFTYAVITAATKAFEFTAIHVIKIFITACVLGAITAIRASLENKKWMLRLSFLQKRWIFLPLYLLTILLFIYDYGILKQFGFREIVVCSALFFVSAGICIAIAEKRYKEAKRILTESITEYKNKIGGK